jgi:hypothetical protein
VVVVLGHALDSPKQLSIIPTICKQESQQAGATRNNGKKSKARKTREKYYGYFLTRYVCPHTTDEPNRSERHR